MKVNLLKVSKQKALYICLTCYNLVEENYIYDYCLCGQMNYEYYGLESEKEEEYE